MFKDNLKREREKNGFTRAQMAKMLGITPTAYGAYERGIREPKLNGLCKISRILHVTPNDLLGYDLHQSDNELPKELKELEKVLHDLMKCGFSVAYDKEEKQVYIANAQHVVYFVPVENIFDDSQLDKLCKSLAKNHFKFGFDGTAQVLQFDFEGKDKKTEINRLYKILNDYNQDAKIYKKTIKFYPNKNAFLLVFAEDGFLAFPSDILVDAVKDCFQSSIYIETKRNFYKGLFDTLHSMQLKALSEMLSNEILNNPQYKELKEKLSKEHPNFLEKLSDFSIEDKNENTDTKK